MIPVFVYVSEEYQPILEREISQLFKEVERNYIWVRYLIIFSQSANTC